MALIRGRGAVTVAVAGERRLVVVVEVVEGEGEEVGAVAGVEETVVVVLVGGQTGRELVVVDPDVGAGLPIPSVSVFSANHTASRLNYLDLDGITIGGNNVAELQVAHNDVALAADEQTDTVESGARESDNGLVAADADILVARDDALDNDDTGSGVLLVDGVGELRESRDGGHSAARAALGARRCQFASKVMTRMRQDLPAVLGGIAQVSNLGDRGTLVKDWRRAVIICGRGSSNGNGSEASKDREELHCEGCAILQWLANRDVAVPSQCGCDLRVIYDRHNPESRVIVNKKITEIEVSKQFRGLTLEI